MGAISNLMWLLIFTNIKLNSGKPAVIYQELLPAVNDNFNITSHLKYKHIKKVCSSRYSICKSNSTKVCGMRHFHNQVQYENFENSCFMFLQNMCDNPGEEYYIISSGTCKDFFRNRRKLNKARRNENDEEDEGQLIADQDEDETNAEEETEAYTEETEENVENYTENLENADTGNDEAMQDEENAKTQEDTGAQDRENESQNSEELEEKHSQATEPNESEEENTLKMNDEQKTEPIEEENDVTTQRGFDYIESTEDTEIDVTTPLSTVKHPKPAPKGSKPSFSNGKRNKGKITKSTKKARQARIFTDVTVPLSMMRHSKAILRKNPTTKKNSAKVTKKVTQNSKTKPTTKATKTTKKATKTTKKATKTTKKPTKTTKKATKATTNAKKTTKKPTIQTTQNKNQKTTKATPKTPASTKANQNAKPLKETGKGVATPATLYPVDVAFDDHICPLSCPTTYSPVCVSANRGHGIYFKFFTFINHCFGDIYYCKHPNEFDPPPDEEEENVVASPLSWSFCAASRYIQFARFTEVASSMGHYGWLAGDYRPTHIMEPHERFHGYG